MKSILKSYTSLYNFSFHENDSCSTIIILLSINYGVVLVSKIVFDMSNKSIEKRADSANRSANCADSANRSANPGDSGNRSALVFCKSICKLC